MTDYATSYPGGATTTVSESQAVVATTLTQFAINISKDVEEGQIVTTLPILPIAASQNLEMGQFVRRIQIWSTLSLVLLDGNTESALIHDRQGTPILGYVSGTIFENNIPAVKLVQVFRRSDGSFLGQSYSGVSDGVFNIYLGNGIYLDEITVVAQGGPNQNAIIIDKVLPIPTGGIPA